MSQACMKNLLESINSNILELENIINSNRLEDDQILHEFYEHFYKILKNMVTGINENNYEKNIDAFNMKIRQITNWRSQKEVSDISPLNNNLYQRMTNLQAKIEKCID